MIKKGQARTAREELAKVICEKPISRRLKVKGIEKEMTICADDMYEAVILMIEKLHELGRSTSDVELWEEVET